MTRTASIVTWIIVVALVILGIVWFASSNMNSGYNATSTATTTYQNNNGKAVVPGAPIVVTSSDTRPSLTAAIVLGTVNPNGADTKYWYEFGITESLGSNSATESIGSGYMTITAYEFLTGLKQNTVYYYRLVAENKYGKTTGGTNSFKTSSTANPTGKKPAIRTLDASAVTKDNAKLNGELNPNGSQSSYWFEYGKTSDLGNTTQISQDGSGTDKIDVSSMISGLDSNTTYYYRIDAYNEFGIVLGSVVSFKTSVASGISAPTVSTSDATNVTNTTATFNGKVDPNGADTMYWFEYSTDSLFGSVLLKRTVKVSLPANSAMVNVDADVTALKNNTSYYFRLVAQNSEGTVRGNRVSFKTGTGSSSSTNVNTNTSGSIY